MSLNNLKQSIQKKKVDQALSRNKIDDEHSLNKILLDEVETLRKMVLELSKRVEKLEIIDGDES
ncbi:hypothetical protein [Endozoicomonas sp. ALB115]|uniref:hypothetical protein n=1 Tax=Endozoicomonas sp. ALB115 TaxID=3403074 RepID=UPI003BB7392E